MKTVSQRQKKVSSELRAQLATAWHKALQWETGFNPFLLSISEVSVSPDLREAFVVVSSLDPHSDLKGITQQLNNRSGVITKHLASVISLKRVPRLYFKACDPKKAHLEMILQSIRIESEEEVSLDSADDQEADDQLKEKGQTQQCENETEEPVFVNRAKVEKGRT